MQKTEFWPGYLPFKGDASISKWLSVQSYSKQGVTKTYVTYNGVTDVYPKPQYKRPAAPPKIEPVTIQPSEVATAVKMALGLPVFALVLVDHQFVAQVQIR